MTLDPNKKVRIIVWFRTDLRLHDNPILDWAHRQAKASKEGNVEVVPVFIFDQRFYTNYVPKYDVRKAGIVRTRFHIQTVQDLRKSLKAIGSELLVYFGDTVETIAKLKAADRQTAVVYHRTVTAHEIQLEKEVNKILGKNDISVPLWKASIKHIDDIPFKFGAIKRIQNSWFRNQMASIRVRPCLETPEFLSSVEALNEAESNAMKFIPKLDQHFDFSEDEIART